MLAGIKISRKLNRTKGTSSKRLKLVKHNLPRTSMNRARLRKRSVRPSRKLSNLKANRINLKTSLMTPLTITKNRKKKQEWLKKKQMKLREK